MCVDVRTRFMANAALLPLSDFAFSLPAVMGSNATPASSTNWVGVAVIVVGLGLYGYGGVVKNQTLDTKVATTVGLPRTASS